MWSARVSFLKATRFHSAYHIRIPTSPGKRGAFAPFPRHDQEIELKTLIAVIVLAVTTAPAYAQRKPCEELKAEIEAKIRKNGVKEFTLTIVPNAEVKDQHVVGSCDGGTKKIIYRRG